MNILWFATTQVSIDLMRAAVREGHTVAYTGSVEIDEFSIQKLADWRLYLPQADIVVLDDPAQSRWYKAVAKEAPVYGGGSSFQHFPQIQYSWAGTEGVPFRLPSPRERVYSTFGLFDGLGWVTPFLDDERGEEFLRPLVGLLRGVGFRGPLTVRWTRLKKSNFLLDFSPQMGYGTLRDLIAARVLRFDEFFTKGQPLKHLNVPPPAKPWWRKLLA